LCMLSFGVSYRLLHIHDQTEIIITFINLFNQHFQTK